ncbi:hypothetical protein E2C01_057149 [Portunus trituberculatus]|uniref:Uncharacterized protein n=1 Tax=Portunus trituberculatus TaxID=210409 RepID=A0A5B7H123_PORTR|nr:hypothetical protein [Portunus trituberculatus]
MTPMGMGVIGGVASNPSSAPECGDLAELSQADLKGLVGEITEEDEIFTSISVSNFELDNIFAEVDDSFLSGNPVRSRDGRCGRDDFIPATPTDSAKTPSDLHMIHIKQELETIGSVPLPHQSDEEPMSTSTMDTVSSTSTLTPLLRSPQHGLSNHNHLMSHLSSNPTASPLIHHMQHTNGGQTFESLLNDETNGTNTSLLQNALQNNAQNGLIDVRHIKRENSVAAANPLLAGECCTRSYLFVLSSSLSFHLLPPCNTK